MVLACQSDIKSLMIIEEGVVQVETEFEKNEFIIDLLGQGSVINYRAIFLND